MKENHDIAKPLFGEKILSVPCPLSVSRFHCITHAFHWIDQTTYWITRQRGEDEKKNKD